VGSERRRTSVSAPSTHAVPPARNVGLCSRLSSPDLYQVCFTENNKSPAIIRKFARLLANLARSLAEDARLHASTR